MAEIIRLRTIEPHWEYSEEAKKRINFFDKVNQATFNVINAVAIVAFIDGALMKGPVNL